MLCHLDKFFDFFVDERDFGTTIFGVRLINFRVRVETADQTSSFDLNQALKFIGNLRSLRPHLGFKIRFEWDL
jgi:hypothetical protein